MLSQDLKNFYVPELGSSEDLAEVVELLCHENDEFQEGDELMVLTTDKAAFSLEATEAGRVNRILVNKGDKIASGTPLIEYSSSS